MLQRLIFALLLSTAAPLPAWAVSVASYASRDDVTVGESFSVNVVVANTRSTAIDDFRISVQRPSETGNVINLADATCSPSNCSAGAQINWTQASLAPGEVFTATFKTTLNTQANTAGTVVTFPIAISGGGVSISNSSLQVRSAGPNAAATSQRLRLSSSTPVLAPGEEAVITATFGNTHATNISFGNTLTVTVPEGLELVEAIEGTVSGQQAQWAIGAINPQTNQQRLLIVRATGTTAALAVQASLQSAEQASTAGHAVAIQAAPTLRVLVEPARNWGWNAAAVPVRIRVENPGDTLLSQITLRARVPAGSGGATAPSDSPTDCPNSCSALNEIVWNVGNLPPGASRSYSYRDLIHNNASVGDALRLEALAISAGTRAIATADVAIGSSGRLELHVNPATPTFPRDQPVPVEIAIGNWQSDTVSLGTDLALRLPTGMQVLKADGGTITATGITWNLGAIAPGHTRVRHILVRAAGDGLFRDGFEPGGYQPWPDQSSPGPLLARVRNNSGAATHTTIHHSPDTAQVNPLRLSVAMTPNPVQPDGAFHGRITVTNTDAIDLFGTYIHLRLPAGTFSALNPSDDGTGTCSYCEAGRVLSWDLGQLPAGASRTLTLSLQLRSEAVAGDVLPFQAWARASNGLNRAEATDLVLVRSPQTLSLAVQADQEAVSSTSNRLTYTLAYGNTSASATSIATLALPLPAGTRFVSATGNGTLVGNEVIWPIGGIQPRQTGLRQVTLAVDSLPEGSLLTTTASLTDTNGNHAYTDVVNHVETGSALRIAVAMNPNPATPSGHFSGEVTITNTDSVDLFGTNVYLRLPAGTFSALYPSDNGTGNCSYCVAGRILQWDIGQLPAGASRTLTLNLQLRSETAPGDVLSYHAWARANNGLDRAASSDLVFVRSAPALRLAVKTDRDAANAGGTLSYTLAYGNTATNATSAATLRLPLPTGTSFVSATGDGTLIGNEVVWSLGSLPSRQTGLRQVTLAVTNLPEGSLLTTTATLTDAAGDHAYADVVNRIETDAALRVAVATTPNPATPSGYFNGTITVTNTDSVDLFGTYVHLRLPAGTFSALNPSDGGTESCSYCAAGHVVTWNLGQMPAGTSRTLTLNLQLRSEAAAGDILSYQAWARASNGLDHGKNHELVRVHP